MWRLNVKYQSNDLAAISCVLQKKSLRKKRLTISKTERITHQIGAKISLLR